MSENNLGLTSPSIIHIIGTIKAIQKRMKDDDIAHLEYMRAYDLLSQEFNDFFDKHTAIFTKVIRGEDLRTIGTVLYYRDKVDKGLITESQVSNLLAEKYLPPNLKAESDAKLKEMRKE